MGARACSGAALVFGVVNALSLPAQQLARARVGVPSARVSLGEVQSVATTLREKTLLRAPMAGGGRLAGTRGERRIGGVGNADRRRWAPMASLLLPGTGQTLLGQDRFVAYLALEAWAVLEFANQRTEARRQQNRYRALARDVARSLYGANPPLGTWGYYEAMEKYVESGVFDRLPGGDVDPEIDVNTHNGTMWLRARLTYWTDPSVSPPASSAEYRNAYNFYLNRAIRSEFRWSWRNAQLEQDLYVRTIRRYNTSLREARQALGIVIANHLLSSVDAFVTLRVEGLEGGSGRGMVVRGRVPLP